MDTGTNSKHLAELQKLALAFSDRLHEQFFPAVESRLLEMADMARNNEQQWNLLQLTRELKRQRPNLQACFRQSLAEGFRQFQHGELGGKAKPLEDDSSTDLALVADDELEQNLAENSLSRRAETRFAEQLFALNQRLAVLQGGRKLPDDGSPLGPYRFAEALHEELAILQLDTRLKVLFYRVFEQTLLESLGQLYQAANEYLVKAGILPNLRYGVGMAAKRAQAAAVAPPVAGDKPVTPAAPVAAKPAADEASVVAQQQLYSEIRELQRRASAPPPPSAAPARGDVPGPANDSGYQPGYFSQPAHHQPSHGNAAVALCSQGEVVMALSSVQHAQHAEVIEQQHVPPAMTVEQYQSVTHQLREQLGADKHIGDDDSRVIDLVGMLFEYMLGDRQLPDSVKAVLSYLHTPYLKVAFMDGSLFEKPDHPARQLLNCLAEAGTRWVNSDGDSQFKVFPKIKSVVRRVLTEFSNDTAIFEEFLAEMQEFNQKVENSTALMERRSREKAEGEERLREVKRRVLREVRKRMQGHELPSAIIVLLLHPWSDYLTFTLLRHGEDSSGWQEALDTIDDVIWSIQPKQDTNERNRLMLIQEQLQARVQGGLETIAFDQAKSNKLVAALNKAQMLALQNLVAEPMAADKRAELEAEAGADLEPETFEPSQLTAAENDMLEQLKHVEFGTWIEFDQLDQHRNLRARIAWFNSTTSRYMLVDRSGKQVAMKSGLDIARMILASQARMLAHTGKPFFERALENILARFKAALAHA